MSLNKALKEVMILYPDVEVRSTEDYYHLINIQNVLKASFDNVNTSFVKQVFENKDNFKLGSANDYYYLVFKTLISSGIVKKAYPAMYSSEEIKPEFDLERWGDLVYEIYDAVKSNKMSLNDAVEHYSSTLDGERKEDENFKLWFEYYQNGEHLKYSDDNLKAKVAFQFPLIGPGTYQEYGHEGRKQDRGSFERAKGMVQDLDEYKEWKNKLNSAIRRIDKLLRQSESFLNPEDQRQLNSLLHHFDQEVRSLRNRKTASDIAFKTANKFKKIGFEPGYEILTKYSQAIDQAPEGDLAPQPGAGPVESVPENLEQKTEGQGERGLDGIFTGQSGADVGEYDALGGDVSLDEASRKLEEVAGLLADRRVVRKLAEFDIMLDKIGIAALFPELAEAQSKLIDAYSYALVRVTKMLGMLSSGRSLAELSEARTDELKGKVVKEVEKSLSPPAEETERGAAAIQEELEGERRGPQREQAEVPSDQRGVV